MLFPEATTDDLSRQWERLTALREDASNHWFAEWDEPCKDFQAQHGLALEQDTPEAWRAVSGAGRKLREAMRTHRFDPDYHPPFFEKLTEFTDAIETALEAAGHIPANVIPPERDELIERITRLEQQVDEERRATLEKMLRERLDQVSGDLAQSKRTLIKIDQFNLINVDPASIVALIRDALQALKHGIDLLNDERFTGVLRKRAKVAWLSGKRFVRAVKARFAAFKFPWRREPVLDEFEGEELDFHLPDETSPRGIRILVRDGKADREDWRVPGASVPFQDRWELHGKLVSGPEMVVIPPGSFLMGSPPDDGDGRDRERPQHEVTIPKAIAVGRFPITFDDWDACVEAGGTDYQPEDEGWGRGRRPVIKVSWEDAQRYIAWLQKVTDKHYRLLSEAEWEYAARAGTQTRYSFGDDEQSLGDYAWYDGNSKTRTHPVGEKKPNAWGLCDMHGNVWEWCEDLWHESYASKPEQLKASGGAWTAGDSRYRVFRGGSWLDIPQSLRSAYRGRISPDSRFYTYGFRVARTL